MPIVNWVRFGIVSVMSGCILLGDVISHVFQLGDVISLKTDILMGVP